MATTNKENDGSVKFGFEVDDKGLVQFKNYLQKTMNMTRAALGMLTNTFSQLDTAFPSKTDTPLTDTKLSDIGSQESQVVKASEETTKKIVDNNEEIIESNDELARSYTLVDYAAVGMFRKILRWSTRAYKSLASAGSNMVETNTRFNRLLGDLAEQADRYAETISNAYAITKTAAKTSITQVYELAKASGISGKNALEMAKGITIIGAELASVWDTSTEQAVNAMISALQGLPKAAKGYSLYLNTNELKQVLKEAGIAVEGELTQQQKVFATWLKALKDAGYAIGDFGSTQTSVANQMRLLTSAITTIKENLGSALNEVLSPVLQVINNGLKILVRLTNQIEKLPKPLKVMLGIFTTFIIVAPALFAVIILVSRGIQILKTQLARLSQSLSTANPMLQVFANTLTSRILPALMKMAGIFGSLILLLTSIYALFSLIDDETKKTTDSTDDYKDAIDKAGKALGKFDDVATMSFDSGSGALDATTWGYVENMFGNMTTGANNFNESIGITDDLLKGIYVTMALISGLSFLAQLIKIIVAAKTLLLTIAPYAAVWGGIIMVVWQLWEIISTDWQSPALAIAAAITLITTAVSTLAFAIGVVTDNFSLMKKGLMGFGVGALGFGAIKTYNTAMTPQKAATGGVTTGTAMSIVGEGRFNEAIIPLGQSAEFASMKNDITNAVIAGLAKSGGSTGNINITVNVDEDYIYKAYNRQSALRGGNV